MIKGNILIVDDEEKLRGLLSRILDLEGYKIIQAGDAKSALRMLEQEDVQVLVSDVKLPDMTGIELVAKIKQTYAHIEIIVLTAYGTIQDGVKAIKNGAFDYITKGDDNDKIIPLVSKAMEKAQLQYRILQLEKKLGDKYSFEHIVGRSKPLMEAVDLARKVAVTDASVLLLGETGTGKEVFAHAIHNESNRKLKNFVAVNCSAFSKEILESELFGHRAGAFTGATKDKKGLFEEAHEGTLFLDEIGDMNIDLQAKLLRVLESGEFIKVGDTKTLKVNVRIIAATNRNLEQEAEKGEFRADLFYRLSVFQIGLPSLNERKADIPLIAMHYIGQFAAKMNMLIDNVDPEFLTKLEQHQWKGNIRELKNVIERAVILSSGGAISAQLLPIEFYIDEQNHTASAFDLSVMEKNHIRKVLHFTKGNKTEAARLMNIGLTTLYRKIEEYSIKI